MVGRVRPASARSGSRPSRSRRVVRASRGIDVRTGDAPLLLTPAALARFDVVAVGAPEELASRRSAGAARPSWRTAAAPWCSCRIAGRRGRTPRFVSRAGFDEVLLDGPVHSSPPVGGAHRARASLPCREVAGCDTPGAGVRCTTAVRSIASLAVRRGRAHLFRRARRLALPVAGRRSVRGVLARDDRRRRARGARPRCASSWIPPSFHPGARRASSSACARTEVQRTPARRSRIARSQGRRGEACAGHDDGVHPSVADDRRRECFMDASRRRSPASTVWM